MEQPLLAELTAQVASALFANNTVPVSDVGQVISAIGAAFASLDIPEAAPPPVQEPAVSIRSSVKPDHVVCLECGKKHKMLKRHLSTEHGLSVDEYRAKWNLAPDHPLVAPNYAARRRELAVSIGLGRKPGQRRGRKPGVPNKPRVATA